MATLKFVTLDNLKKFWEKVQEYITTKISDITLKSSDKTVKVGDDYDLTVNIDGTTIVKDESTGALSVASKALTMTGKDAVKVSDLETGKQVELVIATANKVLTQTTAGLDTTLGLKFVKASDNTADGTNKGKAVVQLTGVGNAVLGEFDASDLVMDGVLDSVAYDKDNGTITFTWNADAGKTATTVDLKEYIKPYSNGDGLNLTEQVFSVKVKDGDKYLTVNENGVASKGIDEAITAAVLVETNRAEGAEGALESRIESLEEAVGEDSVEDQITEAIEALDASEVGGDGKFIQAIKQEDGTISATAVDFSTVFVGYIPEEIEALFEED